MKDSFPPLQIENYFIKTLYAYCFKATDSTFKFQLKEAVFHPHVGFDFYPYIFVWISAILVVRPSMSPCYIPPTLYPPESRVVWIADRHQRLAEVQHGLNSSAVRPLSEISRRVWEYWVDPRQY